mgnify:CR=1 FL=1|jgi:uncharacterized protein
MVSIVVELVYAKTQDCQHEQCIEVSEGCSVKEVILLSCVLDLFPELVLDALSVGIFYKQVSLDKKVQQGDRIEIYTPLWVDPKTARRNRALENKA